MKEFWKEPMTSALAEETAAALEEEYPFVQREQIGTSVYGRPLEVLTVGTGPRKVFYGAAFHANEWLTANVLLRFAAEYAQAVATDGMIFDRSARALATEAEICMLPLADPDGTDLVTGALGPGSEEYERAMKLARNYPNIPFPGGWKANLSGVDLNLSYPAGWLMAKEIKFRQGYTKPGPRDYVGRAPLDQPESLAVWEYTCRTEPDLVIALHSQGKEIYWQYGDIEVPGARELGEKFAALSGYRLAEPALNSSFAGFKDWFIKEFRRPGYTVEAGSGINPLPLEQVDEIYQSVLPILVTGASGA